jgi:hypothetical protein
VQTLLKDHLLTLISERVAMRTVSASVGEKKTRVGGQTLAPLELEAVDKAGLLRHGNID